MPEQIFRQTDQRHAYEYGSGLFIAQITWGADNILLLPTLVDAITYTVYMLDDSCSTMKIPIPGHESVPLVVDDVLLSKPELNGYWTCDSVGYNFAHEPDVSQKPMFPLAGRNYRVEYRIKLNYHPNDIILRYRIRVD
ncbi:MAG: hypothetical protein ACRC2T_00970 [Thermoguttaceae bacterium]